jgi:uncharacterized protein with PQ loop repeat
MADMTLSEGIALVIFVVATVGFAVWVVYLVLTKEVVWDRHADDRESARKTEPKAESG